MKINWKWPNSETCPLFPWYIILYRTPFIIIGVTCLWVIYGCIFAMEGKEAADEWWEDPHF